MSDSTLAKSFEPQNIEAQWGPEWEKRGYAAPAFDARREEFLDPAAAAERHRHAAHGPRVQPDHHGRADALPPHARRQHAVGAGHRPRRHRHADRRRAPARRTQGISRATTSAARTSSPACGSGRRQSGSTITQPDAPPGRLGATGSASTSRWTRSCRRVVTETFVRALRAGPDLPRQAPRELGPGARARRSPTSKWSAKRKTATSGTSAIRCADGSGPPDGRDHAPRDHARRRRRDGASRRRALRAPGRQDGRRCRCATAQIPVIADDYVDREFGTGVVKITPRARLQRLRRSACATSCR